MFAVRADEEALVRVVCPVTERVDRVVVARVEVPVAVREVSDVLPVTVRVPFDVKDEVAVIVPPVTDDAVRELINEVAADRMDVMREPVVVVAVIDALDA